VGGKCLNKGTCLTLSALNCKAIMLLIFYLFGWLYMIILHRDKEARKAKLEKDYYDSYDVVGRIIVMQDLQV
jgi:hypothetical protein